jgi:formylmethanofuran dehydrogenase subunit E
MGLYGIHLLRISNRNRSKRLLVILETDGCFADGVEVATGCTVGQRTLRIEDYGKVAATFVDTFTGEAVRLAPKSDIRTRAFCYAWEPQNRYQAQLEGYQVMPADELFRVQEVRLEQPVHVILGSTGRRINCDGCGEEIINQRETHVGAQVYCQACVGGGYYFPEDEHTPDLC